MLNGRTSVTENLDSHLPKVSQTPPGVLQPGQPGTCCFSCLPMYRGLQHPQLKAPVSSKETLFLPARDFSNGQTAKPYTAALGSTSAHKEPKLTQQPQAPQKLQHPH